MITLIAARARNGAIGKDNKIPWFAPEDLKFFQRETHGGAIIMGRNTWESLPFKPLKNRLNLVITSKTCEAEHTFTTLDAATAFAQNQGYARIYGIGGNRIYQTLLPMADRLLLTEVDLHVKDADTFFPDFDREAWQHMGGTEIRAEGPRCVVNEWLRVK
ncbi:MAG: dihydrofolate reductase [Rhodobacterales bacterium]